MLPPIVGELRVKSSEVHAKFKEAMNASDQLAKKTTGDSAATGGAFDKLGRTGTVAFTAIGAGIGELISHSTEMAGDFQEKMTLLVTGAGESKDQINTVSQGILDMAPKVATSTGQMADGMYMIESAGYHGASGLDILKSAAEGAKVGNADLGTTADALTTVLTDYHIPASQAADVTSKLVATVASGKTHMEDLASSMSHILPFSAGLGVSLNDTMGAMATMTGQGINADQAATYLKFTMMALANETPKGAQALKDVGLSSKQVAEDLKSKGLHGTLDEIVEAIGTKFPKGSAEYTAALADIVGGTRGMASALALTGDNAEKYTQNIEHISEAHAAAGNSVEGFDESMGDLNNKTASMRESFNTLAIKIGTTLIPMLSNAADAANNIFHYLEGHNGALIALASIFGGLLSMAIGAFFLKAAIGIKNTVTGYANMVKGMVSGGKTAVSAVGHLAKGFGDAESGMSGAFGKLGAFGGRLRGVATTFANGGKAAATWAAQTGVALAESTAKLGRNTMAWIREDVVTRASALGKGIAAGATRLLTGAQEGLNTAIKANPIMFIVGLLVLLVGGLIYAYNNVGWFKDFVNSAWATIQSIIGSVVNWFIGTAMPAMSGAFQVIGAIVSWLWSSIIAPYFGMIGSIIGAVAGFIAGSAVPMIASAIQWVGSVIGGAVSFFRDFQSNAQNAVSGVANFFQSLPGRIMGALAGAGGWLVGVGQQIIQGLIDGVGGMVNQAVSAVQNIGGSMLDGVKNFLGIHSPSRRFHDEVGHMMGLGIVEGVEGTVPLIANSLRKATTMPNITVDTGGGGSGGYPPGTQSGGFPPGYGGGGNPSGGGGNTYVTVHATTNASASQIAKEVGYELLLKG